jgi:hypothetical protein
MLYESFTQVDIHHLERHIMSAILFGSISTLADTSELQRRAFNEAFSAHGLDWT